MSSRYHIIFPRGDRTRLSVVEIVDALSYELTDYAVASRHDFGTYSEAAKYARTLADDQALIFEPDTDEPGYLD
jgi:hypothetical protein